MDEIPEGLDDLLNSILGKKKSNPSGGSSALAVSSKAKNKQSIKEDNVEEVILRVLGLDDVSDIDYDTYKTLLREKMAAGRMSNSQMPTEEVELLTDEFKRVKSKTGRFKPKPKKKIKADAFFSGAIQRKSAAPKKQGPAPKTNLQDDVINEIQKIKPDDSSAFIENTLVPQVNKISENLNSIVETLNKQFQLEKKSEKKEASEADTLKKKTRETKLETPEKDNKFKSAAKVALKPAGNFFDMILDFFKNILLGGALLGLIEILKDPSKAFQPFVDFVNKFIDFINSISTWTNENILGPINAFIGGIFDAFNALEDNVNKALALFGADPIDNIKEEDKPVLSIPMIEPYENPFAASEPVTGLTGGSMITGSTGQKISGMGADTQLVALSPGEVVMSNRAGDMYGRDNLLAANAAAGGTNRPKMGKGNLLGFQNGGMVGSMGFTPDEFNIYRESVAKIESSGQPNNGYGAKGGAGGRYDGRYQLGKDAKTDAAKLLGVSDPGHTPAARSAFRESPQTQERFFAAYTKANYNYLMRNSIFQKADSQKKLAILGYAHNQGMGNAEKWLKGASSGEDSFGTLGTRYSNSITKAFEASSNQPSASIPGAPTSGGSTRVVILPPGGQNPGANPNSASSGSQSTLPKFSATDPRNTELIVIKSIYNIVG